MPYQRLPYHFLSPRRPTSIMAARRHRRHPLQRQQAPRVHRRCHALRCRSAMAGRRVQLQMSQQLQRLLNHRLQHLRQHPCLRLHLQVVTVVERRVVPISTAAVHRRLSLLQCRCLPSLINDPVRRMHVCRQRLFGVVGCISPRTAANGSVCGVNIRMDCSPIVVMRAHDEPLAPLKLPSVSWRIAIHNHQLSQLHRRHRRIHRHLQQIVAARMAPPPCRRSSPHSPHKTRHQRMLPTPTVAMMTRLVCRHRFPTCMCQCRLIRRCLHHCRFINLLRNMTITIICFSPMLHRLLRLPPPLRLLPRQRRLLHPSCRRFVVASRSYLLVVCMYFVPSRLPMPSACVV